MKLWKEHNIDLSCRSVSYLLCNPFTCCETSLDIGFSAFKMGMIILSQSGCPLKITVMTS